MMVSHPKLTENFVKDNKFIQKPLLVVDVGARGGPENHWLHYKNQVKIIAFEPDEEECKALNQTTLSSPVSYYPFALYKNKGTYEFYRMSAPAGSSFYKANQEFIERFPDEANLIVKGAKRLQTITLDSFLTENNFTYADFIKVDTEGSELDVLQGSIDTLKESVMGISCEVLFAPWRNNKVVFSDVERFLNELGFRLYDLSSYKYARKSLPGPKSVLENVSGIARWGQIIIGQAIFFRDPIEEIKNKTGALDEWNETKIYKLVSLFEIFGLPDCAIELLQFASQERLIIINEKTLSFYNNLISKSCLGVTYKKHFKNLEKIRKRRYITFYKMLKSYIRKNYFARKLYYFVRRFIK